MQQYVQLKAKDVSRRAVTLEPTNTLGDARNTMLRYNISRIVVAKGSKPVGIVTEKGISAFLYRDTVRRPLDEIRLDQAAKTELVTVREDTDLKTCAHVMLDKRISSLIVVDDNGNLHGVFTKSDLVDVYSRYYGGKHLVQDYMTRKVLTVEPSHSIHTVITTMITNRVSRVVVVRGQKPIGIITSRDLLPISTLIESDIRGMPSEVALTRRQFVPSLSGISHVMLARDVMKRDPVTVEGDSDLAEAAQIMGNKRISGLPVVDTDNNLVGMVTKTDVIRALTTG
ncbi:MAG: CBS domain-containing protein [Nitrososphaerales archaeon]